MEIVDSVRISAEQGYNTSRLLHRHLHNAVPQILGQVEKAQTARRARLISAYICPRSQSRPYQTCRGKHLLGPGG